MNEGVIILDKSGKITFFNTKFLEITDSHPEDVIETNFFTLLPHRSKLILERGLIESKNGKKNVYELLIHKKGGKLINITVTAKPVFDISQNYKGSTILITEITKLKDFEENSKKIELLEILLGGFTHDFNNCLTAILGSMSILKLSMEKNSELNEIILEAEKASNNARFLNQQLCNFSKDSIILEKELTSINSLLEDSIKFLLRGTEIKVQFELNQDLWHVKVNQCQINQVINNIVINAVQALPNGGILKVSTKNEFLTPNLLINPLEPGKYIQISIEDNGIGISKENLSKIFEPYFTTKIEGSGLGLVTSYNIIKNYGGLITVNSQIGVGTTFYIYLPSSNTSTYPVQTHETIIF